MLRVGPGGSSKGLAGHVQEFGLYPTGDGKTFEDFK